MEDRHGIRIRVSCYSGYRGEEIPRTIFFKEKEIAVVKIPDMWRAPDHRYFKCLGDDKNTYIIRYDTKACCWELSFYNVSGS
jgi:hypothetical protein